MLVKRSSFEKSLEEIEGETLLALDTETTGLRPFHGDRLFSIITSNGTDHHYFNFIKYPNLDSDYVLTDIELRILAETILYNDSITWFMHNAKFDLSMLAQEGINIPGKVHCTQVNARIVYNDHKTYDLDSCLSRLPGAHDGKDDRVKKYIDEHNLKSKVPGPGNTWKTVKHYDKVPIELIVPYGERDAAGTHHLGTQQLARIQKDKPSNRLPSMSNVLGNERRLIQTVYRMEHLGVRIDKEFCLRAASYEGRRAETARVEFSKCTGRDFLASGKLFKEVFASDRKWWGLTKKGNPSFSSDYVKNFEHPAAASVLTYRDAKAKVDFYNGFIWHMDSNNNVHPHYNQAGAGTGRFTCSDPNFQNLEKNKDEELNQEFVVRRACVPRDGFIYIMPDYNQVEYKLMLEYACKVVGRMTKLTQMVKDGHDVHQATADLVVAMGGNLIRHDAKQGNFASLYGAGLDTLAKTIKGTRAEAAELKSNIKSIAPEINAFTRTVMRTTEQRRYIKNWFGRISHFPDRRWAYKAPNYLIQGGCADIMKVAMNQIDGRLLTMKSNMIMTIHDEVVVEVHESEIKTVPNMVAEIMETVYPSSHLPLTVGMEWSEKSLADKTEGFPV